MNYVIWILRIVAAVILLQTLYFKFTGQPESVYIFTELGAEPWGRLGSGVVELVAAVLLLIPTYSWMGAGLALGTMTGAILSHLGKLGIAVKGDGGQLFGLAVLVFICSAVILYWHRSDIKIPFFKS